MFVDNIFPNAKVLLAKFLKCSLVAFEAYSLCDVVVTLLFKCRPLSKSLSLYILVLIAVS